MAGIYLHIPFCKQACYYCDFHFSTSLKNKDQLLQALHRELKLRKHELQDQIVESIYFGGGTPSLLTTGELESLLESVFANYKLVGNPEITVEANPDDLTKAKIKELSNSEINRLSVGVQSFFDDDLSALNRAHNAKEAMDCLEEIRKTFDNVTVDLIYGIPGMGLDKWARNLQTIIDLEIPHISSYALTIEPKTALEAFIRRGTYPPVDEELTLQHFKYLIDVTREQSYVQYEISNFGKEGYFSRHNSSYWIGDSYLGIGPSAHSFNGKERSWNSSNNIKYIKSLQRDLLPSEIEYLTPNERFNEYIMTGLRTVWGVSLRDIETRFNTDFRNHLVKNISKFIEQGLIHEEQQIFRATDKGKFLVDGIASELFLI